MVSHPDIQRALEAIKRQQPDQATMLLTEFLADQPGNVQARWLLIQTLESKNAIDPALEQLRQLLIHVKKDLPAIDQIAAHMRQRRYPLQPVLEAYKAYLSRQADSASAAFNYAYNLGKDAQFEAAVAMYEHSLELGIDAPEEVHLNIANIYMDQLHDRDRAHQHLARALTLNPDYASAHYNLGNLFEQQGDRDRAKRNFEKCLLADPANESALARLADTQTFVRQDDPILVRLAATAQQSNNSDVHFALGKAYEQLRFFDRAWAHFSKGNTLDQRMTVAYQEQQTEVRFKRIKSSYQQHFPVQTSAQAGDPVFICGMFRSGSTLLEQMLAAHPHFVAGGESEFFPRLVAKEFPRYPVGQDEITPDRLSAWRYQHEQQRHKLFGDALRLTDKRPDNFLYLGLIKSVLPTARFVITERDWRDIATSIYAVRLGPSQSYATRLRDIRHYIGLQTELIDHWEALLGTDLKRVQYEDLVMQPQRTVTELLGWLGEDWDDRCLAFHELKNSVRTASVWQVREPLHSKSIGRWRNYEQQFIDEFGSEVMA